MAALAFAQSTPPSDSETVAAITQLENDAVKADLAQDSSFYDRYLADDWSGGTSRGTWDTKQSIVADMKDTKNNKTKSESISNVKVHVYGDTAIASYTSTYDSMIKGQHYVRTIISTDTFMRRNGEWKQDRRPQLSGSKIEPISARLTAPIESRSAIGKALQHPIRQRRNDSQTHVNFAATPRWAECAAALGRWRRARQQPTAPS